MPNLSKSAGSSVFAVTKPGLLTTIQDLGRKGYQRFGISPCGAMDPYALRIANRLVSNPQDAAGLEITFQGPEIRVLEDCLISVTGGDLSPSVNGKPIPLWERLRLEKGQVLSFGKRKKGARAYLSIAGGVRGERVLGSLSTDLQSKMGGLGGRRLQKGDLLFKNDSSHEASSDLGRKIALEVLSVYENPFLLRVLSGPQSNRLISRGMEEWLGGVYLVTPHSNRMGYRLEGPRLNVSSSEVISEPIPWGALQVLPNGQLVLLMADRQTVGGYPKIGVLISADVPKAAQLSIGDRVRFEVVELELAQQLLRRQEEVIRSGIVHAL